MGELWDGLLKPGEPLPPDLVVIPKGQFEADWIDMLKRRHKHCSNGDICTWVPDDVHVENK